MDQYNQSFKNMQIQNPNYNDFIVKKPEENKTFGSIEKRLIIDSRDRDYKLYPKPSNYVVKLNDQYKNVTSIELVRYSIPQSGYLINNRNNILIISETGIDVVSAGGGQAEKENKDYIVEEVIKLCPGDYKINDLVKHIQFKLCSNVNLKSNYNVCLDGTSGKICIKSDLRNGGFHLKFCGETELDNTNTGFRRLYKCNSVGKLLGYNPRDHLFACGDIIGVQNVTDITITTMLYNIAKAFCVHTMFPNLTDMKFLSIHGNSETRFNCEFSCYDFIRILDLNSKNTLRFLILGVESDNMMYVVGHVESVYSPLSSWIPEIEMNSIKNCLCCKIDQNPNFEYWSKHEAGTLPDTGSLISLRDCCGNRSVCPSFRFDRNYVDEAFVNANISFNGTNPVVIYKSRHCAESKYDLFYDKYLVLDIPELHRLDSNATPVIDSFTIVPLSHCPNSNLELNIAHAPLSPEVKYYNPPMGKIQKFTIKFVTYDGHEYDFNGREHYLDLRINMLNRQGKYISI